MCVILAQFLLPNMVLPRPRWKFRVAIKGEIKYATFVFTDEIKFATYYEIKYATFFSERKFRGACSRKFSFQEAEIASSASPFLRAL